MIYKQNENMKSPKRSQTTKTNRTYQHSKKELCVSINVYQVCSSIMSTFW
ncbi:hypothetical protein Hanom_Chr08g00729661 [Helianthus anomalus]